MNTNTNCRIVVDPNEPARRGLTQLIRESGHSNCVAFETIEEMESDIDPDASDTMLLAPRRIEWVEHAFLSGRRAA